MIRKGGGGGGGGGEMKNGPEKSCINARVIFEKEGFPDSLVFEAVTEENRCGSHKGKESYDAMEISLSDADFLI